MKGLLNQIALGVFGLLTISTMLLAIFNPKGMIEVRAQSKKLAGIESEVARTQAENKQLNDEIRALQSDPMTIEKIAREELKLVKPGEVVLVTPTDTATPTPPATQPDH